MFMKPHILIIFSRSSTGKAFLLLFQQMKFAFSTGEIQPITVFTLPWGNSSSLWLWAPRVTYTTATFQITGLRPPRPQSTEAASSHRHIPRQNAYVQPQQLTQKRGKPAQSFLDRGGGKLWRTKIRVPSYYVPVLLKVHLSRKTKRKWVSFLNFFDRSRFVFVAYEHFALPLPHTAHTLFAAVFLRAW